MEFRRSGRQEGDDVGRKKRADDGAAAVADRYRRSADFAALEPDRCASSQRVAVNRQSQARGIFFLSACCASGAEPSLYPGNSANPGACEKGNCERFGFFESCGFYGCHEPAARGQKKKPPPIRKCARGCGNVFPLYGISDMFIVYSENAPDPSEANESGGGGMNGTIVF